jgi:hypothetical protein
MRNTSSALLMFSLLIPLLGFVQSPQTPESEIQIDGLKPGESFIELAPTVEPVVELDRSGSYKYFNGRVVDAFTREPVVGAVIESWTEGLNSRTAGNQRIGEAMSGEDGRFQILRQAKARIQAPGYLTFSDAGNVLYDDGIPLYPDPGPAPKIRVIDTEGRPIFNAVITSSISCSHDVPAFEVRTNSEGIAILRGYGMQNNMPELRLRATGFAGTEYLDADFALVKDYPLTVVMPRQHRLIDVKLILRDSSPYKFESINVGDGECYHLGFTDADGCIKFPYRFLSTSAWVTPLGKLEGGKLFGDLDLVPDHQVTLCQMAWDFPEDIPQGKVVIQLPELDPMEGGLPRAQLFHEDGWALDLAQKHWQLDEISFPAGKASLHIGGGFRAFEEEWVEFRIQAGATTTVTPKCVWQPKIILKWPEDISPAWVEAGGFSEKLTKRRTFLFYPKGERVVFAGYQGYDTKFWEALAPSGEVNIGERKELHLVPPEPKPENEPSKEVFIRFPDDFDAIGKWWIDCAMNWQGNPDVMPTDQDHVWSVTVPSRSAVQGVWTCRGYLESHFVIQPDDVGPILLTPMQTASLHVNYDGPLEFPGFKKESELLNLHPGLTHLVVQFEDGRRVGVRLHMESGEEREITVVRN